MAAKGSEAKNELFNKIMEIFPDSFWEDQGKILRVPMSESGNRIEIKVTLTAAKTNLGGDDVPSAFGNSSSNLNINNINSTDSFNDSDSYEMTEYEKRNVEKMLKALNL